MSETSETYDARGIPQVQRCHFIHEVRGKEGQYKSQLNRASATQNFCFGNGINGWKCGTRRSPRSTPAAVVRVWPQSQLRGVTEAVIFFDLDDGFDFELKHGYSILHAVIAWDLEGFKSQPRALVSNRNKLWPRSWESLTKLDRLCPSRSPHPFPMGKRSRQAGTGFV